MKILVTGGNGFLGSHIIKRLVEEGHEVRSVQRSDPSVIRKEEGVEYVQGDLSKYETLDGCFDGIELVFHTAALAGFWGSWEEYHEANVLSTRNVVLACQQHRVRKVVYSSTPSVVFSGESISGADESLPYGENWLCHYAHTKKIAEEEILELGKKGELDVVALRPHLIWGAGDPHLLPRLVNRARTGRLKIVGNGKNLVDITHVGNAAEAHLSAMKILLDSPEKIRGKAYFISDGSPVEVWKWVNAVFEKLKIPPIKKKLPFKLVYCMGAVFEFFNQLFKLHSEPPMTRFVATELAKDHYFDISAAKRDLGYEPKKDLEGEMKEMAEYLDSIR